MRLVSGVLLVAFTSAMSADSAAAQRDCNSVLSRSASDYVQLDARSEAAVDEASEQWAQCSLSATYATLASDPDRTKLFHALEGLLLETRRDRNGLESARLGGGSMFLHAHRRAILPVAAFLAELLLLGMGPLQESAHVELDTLMQRVDRHLSPAGRGRTNRSLSQALQSQRARVDELQRLLGPRRDPLALAVHRELERILGAWREELQERR